MIAATLDAPAPSKAKPVELASVTGPIVVRALNGAYRVEARHPSVGYRQHFFDGSAKDAMAFATHLQSHFDSVQTWRDTVLDRKLPSPGKGLIAHVRKPAGESMAHISIRSRSGQVAGLHFMHSNPFCCYVLGQPTIDGSPSVALHRRRQGLSTWLHDMASEIAGKPIVPHGRNLCSGFLTGDGAGFWDARAERQSYPGSVSTPDIEERLAVASKSVDLLRAESLMTPDHGFNFSAVAALALGGRIEGTLHVREGRNEPHSDTVWAVLPDGRRISGAGALTDAECEELLASPASSGWQRTGQGIYDVEDMILHEATSLRDYGHPEALEQVVDGIKIRWADAGSLIKRHMGIDIAHAMPADLVERLKGLTMPAAASIGGP